MELKTTCTNGNGQSRYVQYNNLRKDSEVFIQNKLHNIQRAQNDK